MLSVSEVARLTGISVRTLHYYDEIGLLKPEVVGYDNGYRYYGNSSLEKLQQILFYRELDIPLKEIINILCSKNYDKSYALENQKRLLTLKKERLERIIALLDNTIKGDNNMSFESFDNTEYEAECHKYAAEVKERWGDTQAFKESVKKQAHYSKEKAEEVSHGTEEIFKAFNASLKRGVKPQDKEAQALVKRWQDFISENYYSCTKEILAGLGQMYVADERFRHNIDLCGTGTAAFMSKAIEIYCK